MDPQVSRILIRIVWSITAVVVWLMIQVFVGLKHEFIIIDPSRYLGNILYYISLIGSLYLLIRILKKWWGEYMKEKSEK